MLHEKMVKIYVINCCSVNKGVVLKSTSSLSCCVCWQRPYIKDSGNARHVSDKRRPAESKTATSRLRSQSRSNAASHSQSLSHSRSDTSSTQSNKSSSTLSPAASQASLNAEVLPVSADDVQSEIRSNSQVSGHYSEDFVEPSVASSRKNLNVNVSRPKKAKTSQPS